MNIHFFMLFYFHVAKFSSVINYEVFEYVLYAAIKAIGMAVSPCNDPLPTV